MAILTVTGGAAGTQLMAHVSHVTLLYDGNIQALDDVSLDVRRSERLCILGPNGSGKSTLASVLAGLLAPDEGEVELAGEQVFSSGQVDFEAYHRARRSLGLVFQNPDDQLVTSIVEEDVAFGPENLGVPSDEIGERVRRELHRVAMEGYAKADPTRLSGGQKQRVAIAGALAMEPQLLVLDEPGALLDVRGRRSILKVMGRLKADGRAIVHITHFMEEALEADRVIVMRRGRIALEGTPQEVFSHADEIQALGLREPWTARLAGRLRELGVGVGWTCDAERLEGELARVAQRHTRSRSTATTAENQRTCHAKVHSDLAVSVHEVSYSYRSVDARNDTHPALDGVSLEVKRAANTVIIGQTGSGKSTLLRLLCALELPDVGRIVVDGTDTRDRKGRRALHGHVGYVMQHPERQLFAETVAEDVAFGPKNLHLPKDEVTRRCRRALKLVGLLGLEEASPFELSGGQQRMCAIAGILAMQPNILILDEPTAGLDPRRRGDLSRILRVLQRSGVTIVQVTHSREIAVRADEVIVLDQSRVMTHGTPREVFSYRNETLLHESGLGLPTSLDWARRLRAAGVACAEAPLTLEELAQSIAAGVEGHMPTPRAQAIPAPTSEKAPC